MTSGDGTNSNIQPQKTKLKQVAQWLFGVLFIGGLAAFAFWAVTSEDERREEEFSSTVIAEDCTVIDKYSYFSPRLGYSNTVNTSCGDYHAQHGEQYDELVVGETYVMETTTRNKYIVAAVNQKDVINE
jgi:hypothetical protein